MAIGHNSAAAMLDEAKNLANVADVWRAKVPEIRDADEAGHALDLEARLCSAIKAADKTRMEEKRPHMNAAAAVDRIYNPITELLNAAANPLVSLRKDWLRREQLRIAVAADIAREAAEQRHREAEAARKTAEEDGRLVLALEAELADRVANEAFQQAQAAAVRKAQVVSASGGARAKGLRQVWAAKLTNFPLACRTYLGHPDVVAVLEKLASAEVRGGKRVIAGFEVYDKG